MNPKIEAMTYQEWKKTLTGDEQWAHCGSKRPHGAHGHSFVMNEGPYTDIPCVGTPLGLRTEGDSELVVTPEQIPQGVIDMPRQYKLETIITVPDSWSEEVVKGIVQAINRSWREPVGRTDPDQEFQVEPHLYKQAWVEI